MTAINGLKWSQTIDKIKLKIDMLKIKEPRVVVLAYTPFTYDNITDVTRQICTITVNGININNDSTINFSAPLFGYILCRPSQKIDSTELITDGDNNITGNAAIVEGDEDQDKDMVTNKYEPVFSAEIIGNEYVVTIIKAHNGSYWNNFITSLSKYKVTCDWNAYVENCDEMLQEPDAWGMWSIQMVHNINKS